jgi:acyl carrier protein
VAPEDPSTGNVLIGRPIANTTLHVLGEDLRLAPVGAVGELYIGGAGVARGYLARPELTAERFVPDPFSAEPGARMYRTGDRVRRLADGRLDFLGRMDSQVKVRGFRIELGEIETALLQLPAVREAVVVVREDRPGQARLVAYVVPRPDQAADATLLQQSLRQALPEHMVPSAFVVMEAFPLSPNGKVDRKALPTPELPQAAFVEPATELERSLARMWRELLGVERVGRDERFFELGGNSLTIVQLQGRLRTELGLQVALTDLFQYPTVGALAEHLTSQQSGPGRVEQSQQRGESRRQHRAPDRGRARRTSGTRDDSED